MSEKTEKNPRGAGRKPMGMVTTTTKVTLPWYMEAQWTEIPNKTEFARNAVINALSKLKQP